MKEEITQTTPSPDSSQKVDTLQNVQEETQEKKPNKKLNKWLFTGLAIVVLAALGVAGLFIYQNSQKKVTSGEATPTISPISSPSPFPTGVTSPTPVADPMADWLTYTNANICYTFKYPQKVTLTVRQEEKIIHLSLWGPTQQEDTEFYDGISLSFSFPLEISGVSLEDYVDSKIEESKESGEILKPKEAIAINGINGYTYTSQGLGTFQNIYLQSPDKTCTVEITNATVDPTNQGYQETVNQILSTFKFTP